MRFVRWKSIVAALVVFAFALSVPRTFAQSPPGKKFVHGKVLTADGEEVPGAVVQLKDMRTLFVRSYIATASGAYHFADLDPEIDYEIRARFRGLGSRRATISRLDSGRDVELNLTVRERRKRK